ARHVRPLGELLAQQRRRAVAAAVVHEDQLVAHLERVERRVEPREQRRQALLFVVNGDDDGKIHSVAWLCRPPDKGGGAKRRGVSAENVVCPCFWFAVTKALSSPPRRPGRRPRRAWRGRAAASRASARGARRAGTGLRASRAGGRA